MNTSYTDLAAQYRHALLDDVLLENVKNLEKHDNEKTQCNPKIKSCIFFDAHNFLPSTC